MKKFISVMLVVVCLLSCLFVAPVSVSASSYPTGLDAYQTSHGIEITWNFCPGVNRYRVYWQTSDGGWAAQGDVYENYFIDTNPRKDWWNVYTVRGIDSRGNWVTDYNPYGCQCWQGGPGNTEYVVTDIMRRIHHFDGYYSWHEPYCKYSDIPMGDDWCSEWCTGFANYVIGQSCGSWRFGGEYHCGAYWDSTREEVIDPDIYNDNGSYNNPACWHPVTSVWAKNARDHGIFRQPFEYEPEIGDIVFFTPDGQADTFDNISHVGIVYMAANNNTVWTVEGNTGDANSFESTVNPYAYMEINGKLRNTSPGARITAKSRYIAGYISMSDIYYRTAYEHEGAYGCEGPLEW